MANRNCHGDYFTNRGQRYYVCFWDSTIMLDPQSETCPRCTRKIEARYEFPAPLQEKTTVCWRGKWCELPDSERVEVSDDWAECVKRGE